MKLALLFCVSAAVLYSSATETDPSRFPVPPQTKKSLFYIHRSPNPNTVVYDACVTTSNTLDPKTPVAVYWIRYGDKGQRKELNYLEKTFAYGVKCSPSGAGRYLLEFVASKEKTAEVFVDATGQAMAIMNINGESSRLKKIFVQVAEDGWWPTIDYVEIFGASLKSGSATYEKMMIKNRAPKP